MFETDDDEYSLPSAYSSAKITCVDDDLDKCTSESVKKTHKQFSSYVK